MGMMTFCRAVRYGEQVAGGLLPEEAHHGAPVAEPVAGGHRGQVVPGHPGPARRRAVQPGQDVHQGGLAAAGRAHDRGQLALGDQQVQSLQRLHLDPLGGVDADQPVAHDQGTLAVGGRGAVLRLGAELAESRRGRDCPGAPAAPGMRFASSASPPARLPLSFAASRSLSLTGLLTRPPAGPGPCRGPGPACWRW